MSEIIPITIANGDGIGPEIMQAVLHILMKSEAKIRIESIEIGEGLYKKKYLSGINQEAWEAIERNKILLKSPVTTPQGGGYKSINVTLRKALGLYANIRPSISYYPFVSTKHPKMDLVIIRENEEDLYAGIEYRHTHNMRESVKLISRTGCEKIIRYAFEYAKLNNRKKVTCMTKDNIMKFSDGLMHTVFNEIAKEYPDIINEHYIVDIGSAKIATVPENFDVIVTSNLFGDIISDITAEISGSVGLAGSANIGADFAMFEAIHGSAPDIAGKNVANPSGLLNAAIMMLVHIGQNSVASLIENAWKKTLEDGIHTPDIYDSTISTKKVGTEEFAQAIVKNLGNQPAKMKIANYKAKSANKIEKKQFKIDKSEEKILLGVDIFIDIEANSAKIIADKINKIKYNGLSLKAISSKGLKLWPGNEDYLFNSDHWCCRFITNSNDVSHSDIIKLLLKFNEEKIDFIKVENLYSFNGKIAFSDI